MTTTLARLCATLPGAAIVEASVIEGSDVDDAAVDDAAVDGVPGDHDDAGETLLLDDATHDSRHVVAGSLFCAVPGRRTDGHDHVREAMARGATAVLVERAVDCAVPQVLVPDVRRAMGPAAAAIHGHPSDDVAVVGVTGTNGKTTTVHLVEAAVAAGGRGTGLIGTVETRIHGVAQPGVRTTPEATDLQRLLARMRDRGVDVAGVEVSSHGLDLHRIDGTRVAVAVFTNLSRDHLDWHGTMQAYFDAKARLFTPELSERAIVFVDDDAGRRIASQAAVPITTVGTHPSAEHRLVNLQTGLDGGRARLVGPSGSVELRTRLPGRFNVRNAAGAYLAATAVGISPEAALLGIAECRGVPGRLERVEAGQPFHVLVDYAHTPDAVRAVVDTVRSLATGGRVIVVLGCGGDRDRDKRGGMGAAAASADTAVLTSDNPRSEDPREILAAVVDGAEQAVAAGAPAEVVVEIDRRAAIGTALDMAGPGDIVLVVGKGHETTQELDGHTIPFDDRDVAREHLEDAREGVTGVASSGDPVDLA